LNHLNKIVFEFQMSRKLICMLYKVWTSILVTFTRLSITYFKNFNFKVGYLLSLYPT
jgi:hypothetical protein